MTMMGRDLENDVEMPEKMEVEVGILNLEIERVAKKLISSFWHINFQNRNGFLFFGFSFLLDLATFDVSQEQKRNVNQ